jgi:hypothetical protein
MALDMISGWSRFRLFYAGGHDGACRVIVVFIVVALLLLR